MTAQLVPLTSVLSVQVDPRRRDFDRLGAFLPDPAPPGPVAARTCSAIAAAARAAAARRLAEIRAAWPTTGEATQ